MLSKILCTDLINMIKMAIMFPVLIASWHFEGQQSFLLFQKSPVDFTILRKPHLTHTLTFCLSEHPTPPVLLT